VEIGFLMIIISLSADLAGQNPFLESAPQESSKNLIYDARVRRIEGNFPYIGEMCAYGMASVSFYENTLNLVRGLEKTKYKFSPHFRANPGHIYNFPKKTAYRKQWNIGFSAYDDEQGKLQYYARIGVGFDVRADIDNSVDDYMNFLGRVKAKQHDFDCVFKKLGSYSEPEEIFSGKPSLADGVLSDKNWCNNWRFYGRILSCNSEDEKAILNDMDLFVKECVRVFSAIESAGFYNI